MIFYLIGAVAVLSICSDVALCGDDPSTWSIRQHYGLDDLFRQTQEAAPMTPDYAMIPAVCDKVKTTESFKRVIQNTEDAQSSIRGQLMVIPNPPLYVTEFGSRRFSIKTANDYEFVVDLFVCENRDTSRTCLLSHGFNYDSLFFVFIIDDHTHEVELKGLIQKDPVPSRNSANVEVSRIEKQPSGEQNAKNNLLRNPLCNLSLMAKLKVCPLLLNAPYYRSKYIPSFDFANVNPKCKRVHEKLESTPDIIGEYYAFPCWVNAVSNSWIKFLNIPSSKSVPLYISISVGSLEVKTFTTIEQGEEIDIVHFDANLKDLFVKDLFIIFEEMAAGVKQIHEKIRGGRKIDSATDDNDGEATASASLVLSETQSR